MKRLRLLKWGGVAVTLGIAVVGMAVVSRPKEPTSAEVLGMVGKALRISAGERWRGEYPRMDSVGTFWPKLDEVVAYCENAGLAESYLTGRCGVRVCYFAPTATRNSIAMAFLDAYEADPNIIHAKEMKPLSGKLEFRSSPDGRVYATREWERFIFSEGVERYYIWDIGNPAASAYYQSLLPVMWEMPHGRDAREMGGWVLYADGSTNWVPYPSDYPMTPAVIERVARLMKPLDPPDEKDVTCQVNTRPPGKRHRGRAWHSPVYDVAVRIAEHLPMDFCKIVACEEKPGTPIGGGTGYRIDFGSSGGGNAQRTFVLLPEKYPAIGEPYAGKHQAEPGPYYLGRGSGYHWFAIDPPYAVIRELEREFGLTGGEHLVNRLENQIPVMDEYFRHEALFALAKEGAAALPALEHVFPFCSKAQVLAAIARIGGPEAEQFIHSVFAPDNPLAFANAVELAHGMNEDGWVLRPPAEVVEAAIQALGSCTDYQQMAEHALGLAFLSWGKGGTSDFSGVGLQLLDRLPEDMRQKVLAEAMAKDPEFQRRLDWVRKQVAERDETRRRVN